MDGTICYLNTDLDLTSADDLTSLAAFFKAGGVFPLFVTRGGDNQWHASFETEISHDEPNSNIASMLAVTESFTEPVNTIWRNCTSREFNVGYDCGHEPWAFNNGISSDVLKRMGQAEASLRITLYPPEREVKHIEVPMPPTVPNINA